MRAYRAHHKSNPLGKILYLEL